MQKKYSKEFKKISNNVLNEIYKFKEQIPFKKYVLEEKIGKSLIEDLPIDYTPLEKVVSEFNEKYLPYCSNDSSINNVGFTDCGNSDSSIIGTLYGELLHQNLINQTGSSPSLTFAEINVIRWLRQIIGYKNIPIEKMKNIYDVGGIVTYGGTMSNTIAMMLSRENFKRQTMINGVNINGDYKVLIAENIGHYSIASGLSWLGLGNSLVYVKTNDDFRMDLVDLSKKLDMYKGKIMACVVYAGDSRTLTVDNLECIYKIVKSSDKNIWLHVDACHGFSLAFSNKHKIKLKGIEKYDSITMDCHKTLMLPYGLSILMTRKAKDFKKIRSVSDLIMQEKYAFGQITPFIGSKNATSLKLWFTIKNLGVKKIEKIVDDRISIASYFRDKMSNCSKFIIFNETDINSVIFMMKPNNKKINIKTLNKHNDLLFDKINKEGLYYLHHFPLKIHNKKYSVLRFMSGNPYLDKNDVDKLFLYLINLNDNI